MLWTMRIDGGPYRVNHAAVAIRDNIYSFGGYRTGEDYQNCRPIDIHVFNTIALKWSPLFSSTIDNTEIPFQRYGHTVVAYQDIAYLWGGRNDIRACNILYYFDIYTRKWTRPLVTGHIPGARDGHSACIIDHYMYIFGGYEEDIQRFSQDVHQFNLKTMNWTYIITKGVPPRWRDFHSASTIGNRMYIFGGRGDAQGSYHSQEEVYPNKLIYLDTNDMKWIHPSINNTAPIGRRSHSEFVYNNRLYIFGGYNGETLTHFGDVYCYDPQLSSWSQVKIKGRGPCPRRRQCCCLISNKLYLFGGTSPNPNHEENFRDILFPAFDQELMDHDDLYVLDFFPSLKTLCMFLVIEYELDQSYLPKDIKYEIGTMTNSICRHPTTG